MAAKILEVIIYLELLINVIARARPMFSYVANAKTLKDQHHENKMAARKLEVVLTWFMSHLEVKFYRLHSHIFHGRANTLA